MIAVHAEGGINAAMGGDRYRYFPGRGALTWLIPRRRSKLVIAHSTSLASGNGYLTTFGFSYSSSASHSSSICFNQVASRKSCSIIDARYES